MIHAYMLSVEVFSCPYLGTLRAKVALFATADKFSLGSTTFMCTFMYFYVLFNFYVQLSTTGYLGYTPT